MNYVEALELACSAVSSLTGHTVDVLAVKRPRDLQGAIELSKVMSKLSPIVGNLLEYIVVQYLNTSQTWPPGCRWIRQDPDFPDALLTGMPDPKPGIEIKAWFPLATEITARFRDSQTLLVQGNTKVALVCWMPDAVLAGQPKILGVWIGDSLAVARARDTHYHNPPEYIVIEPEDTSGRTRNLQQKNCNGLRLQGSLSQLAAARALVDSWGPGARIYRPDRAYQVQLRDLANRFPYRLDTNFAKMDRIVLDSLEDFKEQMLRSQFLGRSVREWVTAIAQPDEAVLASLVDPTEHIPVR